MTPVLSAPLDGEPAAPQTHVDAVGPRVRMPDVARHDALLRTVVEATHALLGEGDLAAALPAALATLGGGTASDRVYVHRYDRERRAATLLVEWMAPGVPGYEELAGREPLPDAEYAEVVDALLTGQAYQSHVNAKRGANHALSVATGTRSDLIVPVVVDGALWGSVGFDDCTAGRVWSDAEVDVLRGAATAMAAAVRRDRAEHERHAAAERRAALLAAVADASEALTRTPGVARAFVETGRVLGEATGVDRVHLFRYDHAEATGHLVAEWARPGVPPVSAIDGGPYAYADYAEVYDPLLAGDVYHSPRRTKTGANAARNDATGTKTDLFVPVHVAGRFWGTLNFDDCTTERTWTDGEVEVLRAAAEAVAAAVRRDELEREKTEAVAQERERAAEERAADLARQNQLLQTATEASRVLIDSPDFGVGCARVLAMLGERLDVDRAAVGVLDLEPGDDGETWWCTLTHEWTRAGTPRQLDDPALRRTRVAGDAAAYAAFAAGEPIQGSVDAHPEPMRGEQRAAGVRSQFALPVLVDGRVWGVLGFDDCRRVRVWAPQEVAFLRVVTAAIAAAVHRQRAEREQQEAVARERERAAVERAGELAVVNAALRDREVLLAAAAQASHVLLESGDLGATMPRALAVLGRAAGWSRTQLILAQPHADGRPGHVVHSEWVADGVSPQLGSATHGWMADDLLHPLPAHTRAGHSYWMSREELPPNVRGVFDLLGILATAGVPIFVDGAYVGVVAFDDCARRRPRTEHEMDALQTTARVIAAAIQRDRLVDAVARERERAAHAQVAELTRANDVLARSLDSLASRPDRDGLLRDVTVAVGEEAGADSATLWLVDPALDGYTLEFVWDRGRGVVPASSAHHPADVAPRPVPALGQPARRALGGAGITAVPDVAASDVFAPAVRESLLAQGVRSVLFVPLVLAGDAVGALVVRYHAPGVQPPARLELVRALANQATLAVHLTRLADAARLAAVAREREDAATQRAEALGRMADAGRATLQRLTDTDGHAAFLGHVLTVAVEQLGAVGGGIWLYDPADDVSRLVLVSDGGGRVQSVRDTAPDEPGPRLASWVSRAELPRFTPRAVVRASGGPAPEHGAPYQADLAAPGVRTVLSIPMFLRETLRGSLNLRFATERVLTPEEEQLAFALANQAVLALELTRLSEESSAAAVAEERNRFARELHDTLAQTFTGIFMQLQAAAEVAATRPDVTRACLERAEQLARDGLRYARQSVAALDRDADSYRDVVAAVDTVVRRATDGTAVVAATHVAGSPRLVEPAVGLHLLRICQEALGNAQRYAAASRIDVRLTFAPDAVTLAVRDDGVGFDPARAALGAGLAGMRHRAERLGGVLTLRSAAGRGTAIEVRVPEHGVALGAGHADA